MSPRDKRIRDRVDMTLCNSQKPLPPATGSDYHIRNQSPTGLANASWNLKGDLAAYGSRKPKAKMSTGPFCYLTTLMGKLRSTLSGTVTHKKMIREVSLTG